MTPASAPTPPPRGDRRRQRTRTAIINAGQRLFAARAMEGVTIDDIVAEAEVAKGSFYNHFDDKEGLANAILDLVHGDCEFHILTANRAVADPAERLVRALCVMMAYAQAHPDRVQALHGLSERRRVAGSPLNSGVISDIGCGLEQGRFVGVPVEAAVLIATTLIIGAGDYAMSGTSSFSRETLAATIGMALLRALGMSGVDADALAQDAARAILAAAPSA